eukprot:scaffold119642_cov55-Phaeocystis_antarctica.AAC.1
MACGIGGVWRRCMGAGWATKPSEGYLARLLTESIGGPNPRPKPRVPASRSSVACESCSA